MVHPQLRIKSVHCGQPCLCTQDPEIIAMTNLVDSYQRSDINEFERILRTNRYRIELLWCTL